jgi:hypothetical protein
MDAPTSLHFHGPFTFVDHGRGIATCEFAHSQGIYLWVLTDGSSRYIHYIGQTKKGFLSRHEDHLIEILSLRCGLFRADAVAANDPEPIFGGMLQKWRRNPKDDPFTSNVAVWKELQAKIAPYLESIEVFFAPTLAFSNNERCHVEGCISWSLRLKHPNEARFYSNRHAGKSQDRGITIPVTSDQPIGGSAIDVTPAPVTVGR